MRHPIRDGRRARAGQIGRKGISNQRRIAGGKLCAVVNKFGLICNQDCATANVNEQTFHPPLRVYGWPDHCAGGLSVTPGVRHPVNVMICRRGQRNARVKVATALSMMSVKYGFKGRRHRARVGFEAHLAYAVTRCTYWRNGMGWNRTRRAGFVCPLSNSPSDTNWRQRL